MKKKIIPILLSAVCLMTGCAALPTQEPTTVPPTQEPTTPPVTEAPTTNPPATEPTTEAPAVDPAEVFWTEGDETENARFEEYTTQLFVDEIKDDALTLHYLVRNFEAFGIERPVMDLLSDGHDLTFYETKLAELKTFDYDSLSKVNQITYDVLLQDLEATNIDLEYTGSNFFPSSGIQEALVSNLTEYQFTCAEDVEDYIVCLLQTPTLFELCLEDEREIIAAGYGLSDRVYDEVIENCRDIAGDGKESFLVTLSNERIANLPVSEAERERLMKKNEEATFDSFLPAYASLADTLESFKGTGVNEGGLAGFGQAGKDYYTYKLQSKLGYTGSVDKIYNLVTKSISTTLSQLLRSAQASPSVYSLWSNWYYYGRGAITFPEDANEVLDLLEEAAVGRFPTVEGITHTVKDLPEALESTYSNVLAYYTIPPVDDYLSGYITINKSNEGSPAERLTTLAHEGFPGHLLQTVYYSASDPAPIRRLYSYSTYTEGWAVY
ncbi:MAG: DUF885 family protein, partial [Christensenellaceae bacterium]